jgi:hypothetical protein
MYKDLSKLISKLFTQLKMGKVNEVTLLQRKYRSGQWVYENVLNTIKH